MMGSRPCAFLLRSDFDDVTWLAMKRWLVRCLLLCVTVVVGTELVLRTAYHDRFRTRSYPLTYQPDAVIGYRYAPLAHGTICNPSICNGFDINAAGFTGPVYPREKPAGTFRIAVLGTSNDTGIWLGPGGPAIDYLRLLEQRLNGAGVPVEVLNFSIDGRYRDVENVILAGSEPLDYAVDLVLLNAEIPFRYTGAKRTAYRGYMLAYVDRGPESLSTSQAYIDWLLSHSFSIGLYRASYLVRALAAYYSRNPEHRYAPAIRTYIDKRFVAPDLRLRPVSVQRSLAALKNLQERIRGAGGELLMFRYIDDAAWAEALDSAGLPFIVLNVQQTRETAHLDGHYNAVGHRLLADRLYAELTARGLPRAAPSPGPRSATVVP